MQEKRTGEAAEDVLRTPFGRREALGKTLGLLSLVVASGCQESLSMRRRKEKKGGEAAGTPPQEPTPQGKAAGSRASREASARFGGQGVTGYSGGRGRAVNADSQALVTTTYRAAEMLNSGTPAFRADNLPLPPTFAQVEGYDISDLPQNYAALEKMVGAVRAFMDAEPQFTQQMVHVRQAFGEGEGLKIMFQRLFPGQKSKPFVPSDGKPILSRAEIAVLREAACDIPHEEIARRLSIEPRTVNSHFTHIYKKLHVNRPLQAVATAISMGYLDMDALDLLAAAGRTSGRNYSLFDSLTTCGGSALLPDTENDLRPLAEFGLFLMVAAHSAAQKRMTETPVQEARRPIPSARIFLLDRRGNPLKTLDADFLHPNCNLVIAPPHAAAQGFTPGNLFVNHRLFTERHLHNFLISEFTPEGKHLRTFGGGQELGTRLINAGGPAFHADGRLLAPSGYLTDALLAFSNGGATVRRWIEGVCGQVAVGPEGRVYIPHQSAIGAPIRVYSAFGKLLETFAHSPAGEYHNGIAVTSDGMMWVSYLKSAPLPEYRLLRFAPDGEKIADLNIPGMEAPFLHADAYDRLYIPCARSRDIKVLSRQGEIIERIPLPPNLIPCAVATAPNGNGNGNSNLWVSGVMSS